MGGRHPAAPARSGASPPRTSPCAACSTRRGSILRPLRPSIPRRRPHRSRRSPMRRGRVGRPARRSTNAAQPRETTLRRQASEQYFTSAQFLAQRRRQLMASPQAAQGLLGNAALLPRKLAAGCVTVKPRRRRVCSRLLRPGAAPARTCNLLAVEQRKAGAGVAGTEHRKLLSFTNNHDKNATRLRFMTSS